MTTDCRILMLGNTDVRDFTLLMIEVTMLYNTTAVKLPVFP